jgi:beta-barrel assembly-enhancing protease
VPENTLPPDNASDAASRPARPPRRLFQPPSPPRWRQIANKVVALVVGVAGVLTLAVTCSSLANAQSADPEISLPGGATDLPDIGSPTSAVITQNEEYQLGAQIVRQLRDQKAIMDDPEVTEYLQSLGTRLAMQAPDGQRKFNFFAVNEGTINAFALPGGFIGVNYGTVLASRNESELAGVVGHEIAHVTQKHIARRFRAQGQQGIAQTAAILAAILIGAMAGGGDAMGGAIAIAQGAAAQQQVNFTRAHEYEADRVGIGFMAGAGFDPDGMATFFESMQRRQGLAGQYIPEIILTHPVNTSRISEAKARANQFDHIKRSPDTATYECIRERLRVLTMPPEADLAARYAKDSVGIKGTLGQRYGMALALMRSGKNQDAAKILHELVGEHENLTLLYSALAQAEVDGGLLNDGIATFQKANALFPRNVPLSVRYGEALMKANRAKEAHTLLLDVFNNTAPTPDQIQLTALAASAAGDMGDAYYYMSEYHIASGDLMLAVQQLELALAAPNLTTVQRQRFQARLDEIRDFLAQNRIRRVNRNTDGG